MSQNEPADCHVCGRHASGVGLEAPGRGAPRWLCTECALIVDRVRDVRRFDAYEVKAAKMAGEAAGALLDGFGKTDLAELDAAEWGAFCQTMCKAFGDSMRHLIRNQEAPF